MIGRWRPERCFLHATRRRAVDLGACDNAGRFRALRLAARSTLAAMLGVSMLGIATPAVGATPEQQDPDGYALVLADSRQKNDAAAFTQFLLEVRGFNRENVVDLFEPTRDEMIRLFGDGATHKGSLHEFLSKPQHHAPEVVVFYSGESVLGIDDEMYVATADTYPGSVHRTELPLEQLMAILGKIPAKSVTVFLDLCSNDYSYPIDSAPTSQIHQPAGIPNGGTDRMTLLAAACGKKLRSWSAGGNMPYRAFTHHLLTALYGMADADRNGSVTSLELQQYLDLRFSLALGHVYGRPQAVNLYGNAETVLAAKTAAVPPLGWEQDLMPWPHPEPRNQPFTVRTHPAGARVRILSFEAAKRDTSTLLWHLTNEQGRGIDGGYSHGMPLPPGDYVVDVSAQGYETKLQTGRHGSERATMHRIELRQIGRAWTSPGHFTDCEHCPEMVVIRAGSCRMGCVSGTNCNDDEKPVHDVQIDRPFALSVRKVTNAEWDACVSKGGCGAYRPVGGSSRHSDGRVFSVSWHDAQAYVAWLSTETRNSYRLPSEAEWEYAARAGAKSVYRETQNEDDMEVEDVSVTAWLCEDPQFSDVVEMTLFGEVVDLDPAQDAAAGSECMVSGCVRAIGSETLGASCELSASGLSDMNGVAWEWVQDCWKANYQGAPSDGSPWLDGDCSWRVARGGPGASEREEARPATRNKLPASARGRFNTFRVALSLEPSTLDSLQPAAGGDTPLHMPQSALTPSAAH